MSERLPELIDPFQADRIVNCSYELSLGPEAFVTSTESKMKTQLAPGEAIRIPPGQFAVLITEESIEIPSDALGLISVKYGFKAHGLVNVSGFHVDPGFRGRLLFSVYNAGPNPMVISRGIPVFLLWYASLEAATADVYTGNRSGQAGIGDEEVMRLQGEVRSPQALALRIDDVERELSDLNNRLGFRRQFVAGIVIAIIGAGVGYLISLLVN